MILQEWVTVTYSNNKRYYVALGYPNLKQGQSIQVKVSDLPKNSNKAIECDCDNCGDIFERNYQIIQRQLKKSKDVLCYSCQRKRIHNKMNTMNIIKANKKRTGELHPRWNQNKDEFLKYASEVRKITEKQPLHLLENGDKPRTICGIDGGYQLDHIVSIKNGFEKQIPPHVIGNIKNLRFIPWEENRSKSFA